MAQTILYLVSEDWYFVSHRLPMARAAKAAGLAVHVATRVGRDGDRIRAEGFELHPVGWRRGSLNPFTLLATVREVRALYRRIKPDLVHHVALVPSVLGSIAALGLPMAKLNAFAGLGFAFTSMTAKARAIRTVAAPLMRWLLNRPATAVLVQNPDDRQAALDLGVTADRIALIPGSGIDVDELKPLPEPAGLFTVAFVGRLLDDKGVRPLVRAHEILAERGVAVRLLLAGTPDPSNPASIPDSVIEGWRHRPNLVVMGHVSDIVSVWEQAHVGALPSRREGLPKSLLEAAACGRALIATDVPGCREIARQNINALLVPVDAAAALADAVETLMKDDDLRHRFAAESRRITVEEFSSARIGREIVALYRKLLAETVR
ncbi:glycosyltransferase family 4 protein [Undibacter mobilis]|uniref:Glycosyltransferase family 1 protein n=1 Tax=Undibacter mobilis TaxID=2292256 RepID=A0A371BCN4_9BRAD|nr:glycosyltransferase family 4 protein [Undibacter mobilis]RDV05111.1 glycosyltransferase family 1 protein [Undibacter mobilis]